MIDWSNSWGFSAGGRCKKPVERKQRCYWLRDGVWFFFFFLCFLSSVFVRRKPVNTSKACWEFMPVFISFCLSVLFLIITSSVSLLPCKFPIACTILAILCYCMVALHVSFNPMFLDFWSFVYLNILLDSCFVCLFVCCLTSTVFKISYSNIVWL